MQSNLAGSANDSSARAGTELDQLWFHTKSNGLYRVLTYDAKYEGIEDSRAVVYQALKDNTVWIRPHSQFMDGRFIRVVKIIATHNLMAVEIDDLKHRLGQYEDIYGSLP